MGTRILVQCYSQAIPGEPNQRSDTMANIICQHKWQRDFDKGQDRLRSTGQYAYDNLRCIFIPVSPIVKSHLQHHPFNPANVLPGYTDEEYREVFGEDKYKLLVMGRILQRRKWGQKLPANEVEFLKNYPELDT
ncbi:hypothetical protein F5883DRAFT_676636 [Diaporthe sp. PMI_573]|nr:hypothetical protein F5883DRAFT_676636 [Diaporthaceae sp. PMI_573]